MAPVNLVDLGDVAGPNLVLRLVQPNDASYVHGLRTHPGYSRYLSEVRGTVEDQKRWIERYKIREANLQEFYYVIERKDSTRCGLVRLYDIDDESFTWGSWILDGNKTRKAALESAVLSFGVGFVRLGLHTANIDVRVENVHALSFYRRFGMERVREDDQNVFLIYRQDRYKADLCRYMTILESEAST